MNGSEIINKLLEYLNLSPSEFSHAIGLDRPQAIYDIQKGKTKNISAPMANKIQSVFTQIDSVWLRTGVGEMIIGGYKNAVKENKPSYNNKKDSNAGIPLIPIGAMAGKGKGDTCVMESDIIDKYVVPEFKEKGVQFLIRVSGASMYPKYSNGDLLACRPVTDLTFFQWGKVYVLDTEQGALVKRLFPCKEDVDSLECRSDNSDNYPPFQIRKSSVRSVAIVVGVIRLE